MTPETGAEEEDQKTHVHIFGCLAIAPGKKTDDGNYYKERAEDRDTDSKNSKKDTHVSSISPGEKKTNTRCPANSSGVRPSLLVRPRLYGRDNS